ncbi:MAG: hypothetical protein WDO71_25080 [Bacteroidota bacterium]
MKKKPTWVSTLKKMNVLLDEDSMEFRNELDTLKLEKEIIQIDYNNRIFVSYFLGHSNQVKDCYLFIDKGIYEKTKILLKKEGIEYALEDICSLLKQTYYNSILISINLKKSKRRKGFNKAFSELVKILDKNISLIKVQTNIKGQGFTTDNPELINLIVNAFKDKIKGHLMLTRQLLVDADLEPDTLEDFNRNLANDLIFNLVLYLHTKTDYKNNSPTKDIQATKTITNRLCEFVYNLVDTINLLPVKDGSPPRIIIRNKFIRYADKHPSLLAFFDKEFDQKNGMFFYEEDEYLQKFMDYTSLINQL